MQAVKGVEIQVTKSQTIDVKISKVNENEMIDIKGAQTVKRLLLPSQCLLEIEI